MFSDRYTSQLQRRTLFITLMVKAARTSETSVYFNETTWRYNPEGYHLQGVVGMSEGPALYCGNLKRFCSNTNNNYVVLGV
jgi:hypothetical protein